MIGKGKGRLLYEEAEESEEAGLRDFALGKGVGVGRGLGKGLGGGKGLGLGSY